MKFLIIFTNLVNLIPLYFTRLNTILVAHFFSRDIKKKIESDKKNLVIVFDFQTNNPTYGEYIFYLVLAKFLELKRKKIEILLITNFNKNSNFSLLSKNKVYLFKNELKKLTFLLLKKNFTEYSNFNKFAIDFENKKKIFCLAIIYLKDLKFIDIFYNYLIYFFLMRKSNLLIKLNLKKKKY